MRHLILMRGAPGAGKSTFIEAQGLKPYTVCPDDFRLRLGGIVMGPDGGLGVSHAHEKRVWQEIEEVLDFKMGLGQLIVLDATFQRGRDFTMPMRLAAQHRYQVACVDFSGVPEEVAAARNRDREEWKVVPDQVVATAYERMRSHAIPDGLAVWQPGAFDGEPLLDRIEPPLEDLNDYAGIMHVGDLQGCHAPVAELFASGFRDDWCYIFVGDLLDRGIQNGEVMRFAVDEIASRGNAVLIWGNHEHHIHRFARNLEPRSREFQFNTLPQLKSAGITREEADTVLDGARDVFRYTYRDRKVLVTHAGLARVPDRLAPLPSRTFWNGTGAYEDPVDAVFTARQAGSGWLQVHGHRNAHKVPLRETDISFNLEGEVEFGRHLRVMSLVPDGETARIETREIANAVYRKTPAASGPDTIAPAGAGGAGYLSQELLDRLENHPLVRLKSFASQPNIRSINFTSKAFFDGHWDEVNMVARGLFVGDDRRIVARSYPKFFNMEERPETQSGALRETLQFPVRLWVKENGFLGILGWNHLTGEDGGTPFFASKSTPESDFAQWFREIIEEDAGAAGTKRAGDIARDRNLSLIFEVNDPERDPHMIAYDRPHVVLLDAVRRQEAFAKVDHKELTQIAASIGVAVKQAGPTFTSWKDFEGWSKSVAAQGRYYQWKGRHVEGFVAEDAAGFLFKIKLDFYSFWKSMRRHRDRVRQARLKDRPLPAPPGDDEEAEAFHHWLTAQADERLEDDIIALRRAFRADTGRGEE